MSGEFTIKDFLKAEGVESWRVISDGACAFYRTGSFAESANLVEAIGQIEGITDHPPNVDIRQDVGDVLGADLRLDCVLRALS